MTLSTGKRRPNRLMQGLIGISLAIHLLVFMQLSGVCRSEPLSYIELTIQDVSKPVGRSIPRPRVHRKVPEIRAVNKKLNIRKQDVPRIAVKKLTIRKQDMPQIKVEPLQDNLSDTVMEDINAPDMPEVSGLNMPDLNPGSIVGHVTKNDYFDMLRLKIESCKRYPRSARVRRIEGRVTLRFAVATDGSLSSLEIVKHARHTSLDKAALNAVRDAVPFPAVPEGMFKGPLPMEITIVFELT